MIPLLEKELLKLGLSEKEAKVFLASLALGPQPVQDIARKAGVNRATTYVMIELLMKRGLMTSYERGKKRYFSAEQPDRLLSLIRVEQQALAEREREFSQALPQLRALFAAAGEQPRVRFFEGSEGLRAIREEIIATDAKELWAVGEFREAPVLPGQENDEYDRRLREKGVRQSVLYVGGPTPDALEREHGAGWSFRRVPSDRFPVTGEITVFGNRIFAFAHRGKLIGVVIESAELAGTLRSILRLAWESAERARPSPVPSVAPAPPAPKPPTAA